MKPWLYLLPSYTWQGESSTLLAYLTRLKSTKKPIELHSEENKPKFYFKSILPAFSLHIDAEFKQNNAAECHMTYPLNSTAVMLMWSFVLIIWNVVQLWQWGQSNQPFQWKLLSTGTIGLICYLSLTLTFWRKVNALLPIEK